MKVLQLASRVRITRYDCNHFFAALSVKGSQKFGHIGVFNELCGAVKRHPFALALVLLGKFVGQFFDLYRIDIDAAVPLYPVVDRLFPS